MIRYRAVVTSPRSSSARLWLNWRWGVFPAGPKEPPLVGPAENFLEEGAGLNTSGMWLREIDYKKLGFDELSSDTEHARRGRGLRFGN